MCIRSTSVSSSHSLWRRSICPRDWRPCLYQPSGAARGTKWPPHTALYPFPLSCIYDPLRADQPVAAGWCSALLVTRVRYITVRHSVHWSNVLWGTCRLQVIWVVRAKTPVLNYPKHTVMHVLAYRNTVMHALRYSHTDIRVPTVIFVFYFLGMGARSLRGGNFNRYVLSQNEVLQVGKYNCFSVHRA